MRLYKVDEVICEYQKILAAPNSPVSSGSAEDDIDCTCATGPLCGFLLLTQLQTFDTKCLTSFSIFGQ